MNRGPFKVLSYIQDQAFCGNRYTANKKMKYSAKGPLLGLTKFLATESPLEMMKNAFYFDLKAPFVLKIFKFFS